MKCPDCGAVLEKHVVARSHQRRTSIRWSCPNESCAVIFIENRKDGKIKIVRDPIMEKKKSHPTLKLLWEVEV